MKLVQTGLWDVEFPPTDWKIDGYFGTNTENAVKAYQSHKGYLAPDGKVGPCTLRALDQDVARHEGYPY
ncbi:peptidoglycan-binding domain-containing protein [Methanosarcina sp. UBA5]|uniref:peptidoglycan-binding domain-containing protein n=1 Tax=Methanosarcina sp. UBA5 TaxID=1915593 RepID=UPI0025FBB904|nr:peptidoglycan-binding domain-containing protein [Methanosarcina sp. UBA5]